MLIRRRLLEMMGGQPPQFTYQVTVTASQITTPKFTFGAGAPVAVVDWGDGTAQSAVTSAIELSHTYTNAGTYTVKLIAPNQAKYLTQIDINGDKIVSVLTPIQLFPNLSTIYLYNNSAWAQDISGWRLFPGLQYLYLQDTLLFGDISSWICPTSLNILFIFDSNIQGCPILSSVTSFGYIFAQNCALPQITVDLYLSRCVALEALRHMTPQLNLGGSNAAPNTQGYADALTLTTASWTVTTN